MRKPHLRSLIRTACTLRVSIAGTLSLLLVLSPAHALVSIDEGRNKLFVVANFSAAHDSNIFASADGEGDTTYALDLGAQLVRRAGLIGLNATAGVNATRFAKFQDENFQDPRLNAEFTKQTGRTTGSLTLGAARQSRADAAANLRNESWNYTGGVNFKYPVIERYYFTGNLGYSRRDYADNTVMVDLASYSAGLDLFYVLSSDRDLLAGYRIRREATSASSSRTDHGFTVGMAGKLIGRLNGSLRAGYTSRSPSNSSTLSPDGGKFSSWTAAATASWNPTKRLGLTGQLGKDFSTASTNTSLDTLFTSLNANYALSSKTAVTADTSWSDTRFLGSAGGGRQDHNWGWSITLDRIINDHLKFSLGYSFAQNWSTDRVADFTRRSVTLTVSANY